MMLPLFLSPLTSARFFLPKYMKYTLQSIRNIHTAKKISSQAYVSGSDKFTFCGLNRTKSTIGIAGRIKAVGSVFSSCFPDIFIVENNLDNHKYAINDITAVIEKVKITSRATCESIIIYPL